MENFINLITNLGIFAILFVVFAETGLLVGFVFPGDSLLFTSGFLVQQNILHINVHVFVLCLFIAGVLGESTGYLWGLKLGKRLYNRPDGRFFKKAYLEKSQSFYKKYGPIAIVLAVFVPIVRTFVPLVAGISKMDYKKFIPFNILGIGLWTAGFTYLGYFAGAQLHKMGINVEVAALIIIFLSLLPMIIGYLRSAERRKSLIDSVKSVFAQKEKKS